MALTPHPPLPTPDSQAPPGLSVFVYGTLKPGGRYYKVYCETLQPQAIPAWIQGRLYHLPALGYPAVTQGPDRIQGYVLRFDDASVLEELDELEQYEPGRPEHSFYVRHWLTVSTEAGPMEAWVYLMSEETIRSQGGVYLPSGEWPHMDPA